jgi:hypothetical protein
MLYLHNFPNQMSNNRTGVCYYCFVLSFAVKPAINHSNKRIQLRLEEILLSLDLNSHSFRM